MPTPGPRRPHVICHMAASTDGRIAVDGWPDPVPAAVRREYERVHAEYEADGWLCGRVTMEPFAGALGPDTEVAREHAGAQRLFARAGFRRTMVEMTREVEGAAD